MPGKTTLVVLVPNGLRHPPFACSASTPYGLAGFWWAQDEVMWLCPQPETDPRAVVMAAKEWHARGLICVALGIALSRLLRPGDWVVPDDYVDLTRGGPTTFFEGEGRGYLPQIPPFAPELRHALLNSLQDEVGPRHFDAGVLVGYTGPRVPTPAEARAWRLLGGDVAAPLALPLIYLAREQEVPAATAIYITQPLPQRPDTAPPPAALPAWDELERLIVRTAQSLSRST
ncbi:MAG: hypothetical protein Q9O62_11885 [Ardenticatenia bacterium]|nr:hypothetical protein [Ardenticatenia bacterium]